MSKICGLATVMIMLAPLGASAQTPNTIIGESADTRRWFTLRLDYVNRRISDGNLSLKRSDASLGATFYALPWLGLFTRAHYGRTDFSFAYTLSKGFKLTSEMANEDLSLEAGTRVGIVSWKMLTLDAFASYEITPYQPRFRVNAAKVDTPFGQFDCKEFCSEHADFRYNMSQLNAGATVYARLWRFVPRLAFQYQRLSASFDPRLDPKAAETIGLFGFDQAKAKDDLSGVKHIPSVSPGLSVELPHGFTLDAECSVVPTKISNFMTVSAGASWSY